MAKGKQALRIDRRSLTDGTARASLIAKVLNLDNRMCWVNAENAKSGHALSVPMNNEIVNLFQSLRGNKSEFVFTRCGHGMVQIDDKMFKRACKKRI